MRGKHLIFRQQSGFVAIFSVLIIMGILTLLVIGFSNITRQAQKRALDDHLSTQALYAAESGINLVSWDVANGNPVETFDDCDANPSPALRRYNHIIDNGNSVGISCLLVNMKPSDLEFSQVPLPGEGSPAVSRLHAESGNISSLSIEWDDHSCEGQPCPIGNRSFNNNLQLVSHGDWGSDVGMLRIDLTPTSIAASNRDALVDATRTFYLYPTSDNSVGTTTLNVGAGINNQGVVLATLCNQTTGPLRCRAVVNLSASNTGDYYIRLTSYYNPPSLVRVSAYNGANANAGSRVDLINGQAVVDATGRATDVYRRLQARIPLDAGASYRTGLHEGFSLFSGNGICKLYSSLPDEYIADGGTCPLDQ